MIGDEMLTPDSSRFWPAKGYEPGHGQPSFDKQFARDWLTSHPGNDWTLPQEIVDKTIAKYLEAYEMITGKKLEAYPPQISASEFSYLVPHFYEKSVRNPSLWIRTLFSVVLSSPA